MRKILIYASMFVLLLVALASLATVNSMISSYGVWKIEHRVVITEEGQIQTIKLHSRAYPTKIHVSFSKRVNIEDSRFNIQAYDGSEVFNIKKKAEGLWLSKIYSLRRPPILLTLIVLVDDTIVDYRHVELVR